MSEGGKIWWVTLDDRGQLTLPAELLRRLGLLPGADIALVLARGEVYLSPVRPESIGS